MQEVYCNQAPEQIAHLAQKHACVAATGSVDVVRILLKYKADKKKTNKDGETPAKLVEKNQELAKDMREELLAVLDTESKPSGKESSCVIC